MHFPRADLQAFGSTYVPDLQGGKSFHSLSFWPSPLCAFVFFLLALFFFSSGLQSVFLIPYQGIERKTFLEAKFESSDFRWPISIPDKEVDDQKEPPSLSFFHMEIH